MTSYCSYSETTSGNTTTVSDGVWYVWSSNSSDTTAGDIWGYWIGEANSTTTITNCTVSCSDAYYPDLVYNNWVVVRMNETKAQKRERERQEAVQAEENRVAQETYQAREKAQKEAREKTESIALELLMELIGEKEAEVYRKTGRLFVKGINHDYLIHKDRSVAGACVTRIEKDKLVDLCVHLPDYHEFPMTDNVIALKMAIETDPDFKGNVIRNRPKEALPLAACVNQ